MPKLLALAAALALMLPGAALAKPPVWVIRDADSTIVLFGSVHLLPEDADWRPQALTEALQSADDIWFEVPLDDAARLAASQNVTIQGMLPAGERLSALLPPAVLERLRRIAPRLNLNPEALEPMRPWLAEIYLAQAFIAARGGRQDLGVERVLNAAAPGGARRRAFETPDQQVETLARTPPAEQISALAETLRTIEEEPDAFDDLIGYWLDGDLDGILKEAVDPVREQTPRLYERMVRERNAQWVPQILERMAGSGETVIVVGVGHLIGPDSVPAMLRAQGVAVEGP